MVRLNLKQLESTTTHRLSPVKQRITSQLTLSPLFHTTPMLTMLSPQHPEASTTQSLSLTLTTQHLAIHYNAQTYPQHTNSSHHARIHPNSTKHTFSCTQTHPRTPHWPHNTKNSLHNSEKQSRTHRFLHHTKLYHIRRNLVIVNILASQHKEQGHAPQNTDSPYNAHTGKNKTPSCTKTLRIQHQGLAHETQTCWSTPRRTTSQWT